MDSPPTPHRGETADVSAGWDLTITSGSAGTFHAASPLPEPATGRFRHEVWIHRPTRSALVLGSTQPEEMLDNEAAAEDNVEICRRRSGGGLVFVDPRTDCWIDLIIPTESRFWNADIGKAFHWVGEHWKSVLAELLLTKPVTPARPVTPAKPVAPAPHDVPESPGPTPIVHYEPASSDANSAWCFGQIGHGEVTFEHKKIVGLSQRRTRRWTRIQGIYIGTWPVDKLKRYVDAERLHREQPEYRLIEQNLDPSSVAAGIGSGHPSLDPEDLASRFVATIPAP